MSKSTDKVISASTELSGPQSLSPAPRGRLTLNRIILYIALPIFGAWIGVAAVWLILSSNLGGSSDDALAGGLRAEATPTRIATNVAAAGPPDTAIPEVSPTPTVQPTAPPEPEISPTPTPSPEPSPDLTADAAASEPALLTVRQPTANFFVGVELTPVLDRGEADGLALVVETVRPESSLFGALCPGDAIVMLNGGPARAVTAPAATRAFEDAIFAADPAIFDVRPAGAAHAQRLELRIVRDNAGGGAPPGPTGRSALDLPCP